MIIVCNSVVKLDGPSGSNPSECPPTTSFSRRDKIQGKSDLLYTGQYFNNIVNILNVTKK